jgi:hypothetical protein
MNNPHFCLGNAWWGGCGAAAGEVARWATSDDFSDCNKEKQTKKLEKNVAKTKKKPYLGMCVGLTRWE